PGGIDRAELIATTDAARAGIEEMGHDAAVVWQTLQRRLDGRADPRHGFRGRQQAVGWRRGEGQGDTAHAGGRGAAQPRELARAVVTLAVQDQPGRELVIEEIAQRLALQAQQDLALAGSDGGVAEHAPLPGGFRCSARGGWYVRGLAVLEV